MPPGDSRPYRSESRESAPLIRCRPPGPMSLGFAARLESAESPAFGARRKSRAEVAGAEMSLSCTHRAKGRTWSTSMAIATSILAAGFGALLLGHAPAKVARALDVQADRLWMALGDLYPSDVKVALVEKVAALYPERGRARSSASREAMRLPRRSRRPSLPRRGPASSPSRALTTGSATGRSPSAGLKKSWREAFADQLNPHVSFVPYPRLPRDLDRVSRGSTKRSTREASAPCSSSRLGARRLRGAAADVSARARGADEKSRSIAHRRRDLDGARPLLAIGSRRRRWACFRTWSASAKGSAVGCRSRLASDRTPSCRHGVATRTKRSCIRRRSTERLSLVRRRIATLDVLAADRLAERARAVGDARGTL